MREERHFAASVVSGGRLHVLGGRDGKAKPMALGTAESYGGDGRGWRPEPGLSQERAYHCAAALGGGDVGVVTGGYSYNAVVAMAQARNLTSRGDSSRWANVGATGNLGQARYLHGCAAVDLGEGVEGVLVAGGYSTDYLRSTELWDPLTGEWSQGGDLATPRQGGRLAVLDGGTPVILGGFHSTNVFPASAEAFSIADREWSELEGKRLRVPRRYFAVAEVPRTLFGC